MVASSSSSPRVIVREGGKKGKTGSTGPKVSLLPVYLKSSRLLNCIAVRALCYCPVYP